MRGLHVHEDRVEHNMPIGMVDTDSYSGCLQRTSRERAVRETLAETQCFVPQKINK